ncbi:hypothetical protein [Paracoccus actinidiae]|jgi:hypothetical protein|uniref:hypothetical protein n=1 Tax=Paracoccus actinidiae TaxID=3064531 RepID=UPI0027D28D2F|nr:hypothetical protein [Paracoccus sp. M09]
MKRDTASEPFEAEPITQISEEGDAKLAAGLHQPEHGVVSLAATGARRAVRDPALGRVGPQIVIGSFGVE